MIETRQALIERAKNVLGETGNYSHPLRRELCDVTAKLIKELEGDDSTTSQAMVPVEALEETMGEDLGDGACLVLAETIREHAVNVPIADGGTTIVPPATARDMKIVDPRYTLLIEHSRLDHVYVSVAIPDHPQRAMVSVDLAGAKPYAGCTLSRRYDDRLGLSTRSDVRMERSPYDDQYLCVELVPRR